MTQAVYFNRTYDETMTLMVEARAYLAEEEGADRRAAGPIIGLRMSCEAMRVTSRLAQVMAWLMVQKAVHVGEMTPEQAADDEHRLSGSDICLDHSFNDDPALPHGLLSLMERSHRLYQRVARLEEMFVRRVLH